MRQSKNPLLSFSVALMFGSALLMGCTTTPEAAMDAPEGQIAEAVAEDEAAPADAAMAEETQEAEAAVAEEPEAEPAEEAAQADEQMLEDKALAAYEQGLAAYKSDMYMEARVHLQEAQDTGVSLGWWKNRKLRGMLKRIDSTLQDLRENYQAGVAAYERGGYDAAAKSLRKVQKSDVSLGEEVEIQVANMLAAIDREQQQMAARAMEPAEAPDYESQAQMLREQAEVFLAARKAVAARQEEARRAFEEGDLEAAKKYLAQVRALASEADVAQLPGMQEAAAAAERQIADVEAAIARREEQEAVGKKVDAALAEAKDMVDSQPLEAEAKAVQAREMAVDAGMELSDAQAAQYAEIMAAVDRKFGGNLGLVREEYRELVTYADRYLEGNEPAKAVKVLELVEQAPEGMVSSDLKNEAGGKLAGARAAAQVQKTTSERLAQWLAGVGNRLAEGPSEQALNDVAMALQNAREDGLGDRQLLTVLEKAVGVLGDDFRKGLAGNEALRQAVDQGLAKADVLIAYSHAAYYVENDMPELAKPYLQALAGSSMAGADTVDWAKQQLEAAASGVVGTPRSRQVESATKRVYELSRDLMEAAQEGDLDKAASVEQRLAEAEASLSLAKAQAALDRGAFGQTAQMLAALPEEEMEEAGLMGRYSDLAEAVGGYQQAQQELEAAQAALSEYDVAKAADILRGVETGAAGRGLLTPWKEALVGVVAEAREAEEPMRVLSAQRDQLLAEAKAMLDVARAREGAWQDYYAGVEALLNKEFDAAAMAMSGVVARADAAEEFEVADAQDVVDSVGTGGAVQIRAAQKVLDRAQAAYDAGNFMRAGMRLDELREMAGYSASPSLKSSADELQAKIEAREAEAQELYFKAIAAHKGGQQDELRRLMARLAEEYRNTRTYRDNM